jgi:hypothetical protein
VSGRLARALIVAGVGAGLLLAPRAVSADKKTDQPVKAESLTREQFDRLSDAQVIELKGKRMTAGEIRAQRKGAQADAETKAKIAAAKAQTEFEAEQAKFAQAEKTKLEAANAKVQSEASRVAQQGPAPAQSGQLDAIRREAGQLVERSKTASPAERPQIEQRATQLIRQLQQMGHGPAGR